MPKLGEIDVFELQFPAPRLQEFRDLADLFLVDHFLKNLPSKKQRGIVGSKDRF
jgi:hypothetical protein